MIFCRKCGRYYADGEPMCTACGADLRAKGHSSFSGAAVKISGSASAKAGVATVEKPAPPPEPEPPPPPPAPVAAVPEPTPVAPPPEPPVIETPLAVAEPPKIAESGLRLEPSPIGSLTLEPAPVAIPTPPDPDNILDLPPWETRVDDTPPVLEIDPPADQSAEEPPKPIEFASIQEFPTAYAGTPFDRDKFLLRQKAIAINEKYYVNDEYGQPILFVERPALLMQQLLMLAGAAGVFFAGTFAITFISGFFGTLLGATTNTLVSSGGFVIVVALSMLTFFGLMPKRHVQFYTDDSRTQKILEVRQENKVPLPNAKFTVLDEAGNIIGRLRKNMLFDVIRRRWYYTTPNGLPACTIKEDSVLLSLLRRTIPLFAYIRTNFIFLRGDRVIGEFNRKLTILDRYVLDMTADVTRTIDRRMALAIGVMLDTSERR